MYLDYNETNSCVNYTQINFSISQFLINYNGAYNDGGYLFFNGRYCKLNLEMIELKME